MHSSAWQLQDAYKGLKSRLLYLWLLCFALWGWPMAQAQTQQSPFSTEGDSLRISLLTCSPGKEVYALYGHTAIRVTHLAHGLDEVYNYGLFDFNAPNFGWRFALGQTDYYLGKQPYAYFEQAYIMRGSYIVEQVLNLTASESERLLRNLEDTLHSPNRIYRYNYFYKNCSSMARDAIARAIAGQIVYQTERAELKPTFRAVVHEYTASTPWNEFSQDLLLGYAADTLITLSDRQFAPQNLLHTLATARIVDNEGAARALVQQTDTIGVVTSPTLPTHTALAPWQVAALLLILTCMLLLCEYRTKRVFWAWDVVFLLLQGTAGLLVGFMMLWSEHPAVSANWIVLVLNPLILFYLPRYIYLRQRQQRDPYNAVSLGIYSLFLVAFCLQWQWISSAMGLLALNLLLLHSVRFYQQYHNAHA